MWTNIGLHLSSFIHLNKQQSFSHSTSCSSFVGDELCREYQPKKRKIIVYIWREKTAVFTTAWNMPLLGCPCNIYKGKHTSPFQQQLACNNTQNSLFFPDFDSTGWRRNRLRPLQIFVRSEYPVDILQRSSRISEYFVHDHPNHFVRRQWGNFNIKQNPVHIDEGSLVQFKATKQYVFLERRPTIKNPSCRRTTLLSPCTSTQCFNVSNDHRSRVGKQLLVSFVILWQRVISEIDTPGWSITTSTHWGN